MLRAQGLFAVVALLWLAPFTRAVYEEGEITHVDKEAKAFTVKTFKGEVMTLPLTDELAEGKIDPREAGRRTHTLKDLKAGQTVELDWKLVRGRMVCCRVKIVKPAPPKPAAPDKPKKK